jgi:hypothetical protein
MSRVFVTARHVPLLEIEEPEDRPRLDRPEWGVHLRRVQGHAATALRVVFDNHLADVRLVDAVRLVALAGCTCSARAAQIGIPWPAGMVLAIPANAPADRTRRIHAFVSPLNELDLQRLVDEGSEESLFGREP